MCGIAGVAGRLPPPGAEPVVRRMLRAMAHRGPDDEGTVAAEAACLGAVRLAILDPSPAGRQPMRDGASGTVLAQNGEIYNHLLLRADLPGSGWRGTSDTETLLAAWLRWGPSALERLRGMFAVAVADGPGRCLWLARDRFGIKPLYWWQGHGIVLFASEVRALLASGLVPAEADPEGLAGFVRYGSVPEPFTLVRGVRSLPPGHRLRIADGRAETPQPWYRLEPAVRAAERPFDAPTLRAELARAVREHLLSDVPVASFLSAGLDSGAVTALAASALETPLRTLTVGRAGGTEDEGPGAQAVARRWNTLHETIRLSDAEVLATVPEGVRAMDQPSIDGLNTFVVSRVAHRGGCKVALSGLGGDEVFGGYRSFRTLPRLHRHRRLWGAVPGVLRGMLAPGAGRSGRVRELTEAGAGLAARYETLRSLWSRRELDALGLPPVGLGVPEPAGDLPLPTRVALLEMGGYLRSVLLRDADALSMASSLELRVPLLDHRLVEVALGMGAPGHRGRGPKPALQAAARDLFSDAQLGLPKRGFALPMDAWMRGPLREHVGEGCEALGASGLVPREAVAALAARFEGRRLPWSRLWSLAVLGHWLRRHLAGAAGSAA